MARQKYILGITALSVALLGACSSQPASVADTVDSIIDKAGTTQVARITATLTKDGPKANVVAVHDGSFTEYMRRPADSTPVDLGDPTFSFIEGSFDVSQVDLAALEEDMKTVPECDEPRGEVRLIGTHVVESVNCGLLDAPITKRIDGKPVETIPGGDMNAAILQLQEDIAIVDGTEISEAQIVMDTEEPWTSVTVTSPTMDYSNGAQCQVSVEHSLRGLNWGCKEGLEGISTDAINDDVIMRIWEAEGSPRSNWNMKLTTDSATGPSWRAISEEGSQFYDLEGNRL